MNFYIDENLSEYVADALNNLNKGYFPDITVQSTKLVFGKGAKDEDIIPGIGEKGGILITKDLNIHRRRAQYQLCSAYSIGVFFLKMPKGFDKHWEVVKLLVNNWEMIVETCRDLKMPFGFEIPFKGKMRKLED